jgi:hypothetical protein
MRGLLTIITVVVIGLALAINGGRVVGSQRVSKCPANPDKLYPQNKILKQLAATLNRSIPEYRSLEKKGFYINGDERPRGFFIYDLSDTSNKETKLTECIKFIDGHVYHFSPIYYPYSFSHIAILKAGQLKVFRSVNCSDRGDSIDDVIRYLEQNLPDQQDKADILDRVGKFRTFGFYNRIDSFATLQCKAYPTK